MKINGDNNPYTSLFFVHDVMHHNDDIKMYSRARCAKRNVGIRLGK